MTEAEYDAGWVKAKIELALLRYQMAVRRGWDAFLRKEKPNA